MMKALNVQQGSTEWLDARARHYCASEAAAMMGLDPRCTRSELLRMKASGDEKEFSDFVREKILDKGHEIEEAARAIVEKRYEEELYQSVGVTRVEGLDLLASYDGMEITETWSWECKSRNAELWAAVERGEVPDAHWPQLEHQLLVSGAEKVCFTVSDGTEEGTRDVWYESRPARRKHLIAAWKQFRDDLAAYQHVEVKPKPEATQIKQLPALIVQLRGEVTSSNLTQYRETALAFIGGINTDLQTDKDFVDADAAIKFCAQAEEKIDLVKQQALEQTASIAELFATLDELREAMRGKRLTLDKLVKARKESIREEIRRGGVDAYNAHLQALNKRLGRVRMNDAVGTAPAADFAGVMRGKKTIESLRNAVDTELARVKIEASAIADRVQINLKLLDECPAFIFLFNDLQTIAFKANDDFAMIVKTRINEHRQAEEKRLEAERARIRQEEEAKAAAKQAIPSPTATASGQAIAAAPTGKLPTVSVAGVATIAAGTTGVRQRPSDDDMIGVLAMHYHVHESKVIEWLLALDLKGACARLERELTGG